MSLEITSRTTEGITILDMRGRLVAGEETGKLRDYVNELVAKGPLNAVLNLASIDFIDSTGLGAMVLCYSAAKKSGGALRLLNLKEREIELLVLTKLNTIFEVFADEQDAVNSFYPDRAVKRFDILSFVQSHSPPE
ncbi:MAG: STAS domain-containing protein [Acidobacteria bacterium]|nr:STAS domain-containing protein [Acidobacteriota bacterium]